MSFRFCDRRPRPACGARVPPLRTRAAAWPFRLATSDYGRVGTRIVGGTAASPLRPLFGGAALLRRPCLAPDLEQLGGPRRRDLFDRIGRPEARVRLPVGHVRAEPALLEDDRLLADGVVAELLQ